MAGGKGTRIAERFPDIPKPLIPVDGIPILEREIISLRDQGYTEIILTVSHMAEKIIGYFNSRKLEGVTIDFYVEKEPLGNAGALFRIRDRLPDDFLLLNADSMFDVDFDRFVKFHKSRKAKATIFTHPNSHPYDSGLIISDNNNMVMKWLSKEDKRPAFYKNNVNAGLHIISPELLAGNHAGKVDLDRDILKPLAGTGMLYSYSSPEYVKDMGTPERYESVSYDVAHGIVEQKNLRNKQRAIFLDRDGTINRYVGFLRHTEEMELLPGVAEAIKMINRSGYLAIVVTNQPVVARGETTFDELDEIHNKMETLLGEQGAYLDGIYFCPHHPDKGFPGEVTELKVDCACRKPKPGMLYQAAKDLHIDLASSWMIGDSWRDVACGKNGGTHTCLLTKTSGEQNETSKKITSDMISPTLLEAIRVILDQKVSP